MYAYSVVWAFETSTTLKNYLLSNNKNNNKKMDICKINYIDSTLLRESKQESKQGLGHPDLPNGVSTKNWTVLNFNFNAAAISTHD